MREHAVNNYKNFICGWYLEDPVIDELIDYHKRTPLKGPGKLGLDQERPDWKKSTDCIVPTYLTGCYLKYLGNSIELYKQRYPACSSVVCPWKVGEIINIQHYSPGEGYFAWHSERTGSARNNLRHLVFLTYLNDVSDEGETEFFHQNLKIKPERGLTLIWPTDWNFLHRGVTSRTQEKYIATGWIEFV